MFINLRNAVSSLSTRTLRLLLLTAVLVAGFTTSSNASFSNTATVPASSFTTGTLDLGLSTVSALFNVLGLKPGDLVYAPLTLPNNGTLPLSWQLSASGTNTDGKGLVSALGGEVRAVAGTTCNASTFASSSTVVASPVTDLTALGSSGGNTLAVGATQTLCFKVNLPLSASNLLQGASTSVAFTFNSVAA